MVSKTRVVVGYEGVNRALFSVKENRNNKDLTVVFFNARNFEDEKAGLNVGINLHKLSIHGSPNSSGTTISRELILADGRRLTSSQFIKDSKDSLFTYVFGALMPELADDRYKSKPRAKDTVVRVGKFKRTDYATFVYHIVVANHGALVPYVHGHSCSEIDFERWKLAVYATYVNMPSSVIGRLVIPSTRTPKTDGVPDEVYPSEFLDSEGADSLEADKLSELLSQFDNEMSGLAVKGLAKFMKVDDPRTLMPDQFWFHPTVDSLAAQRRGLPPGFSFVLDD